MRKKLIRRLHQILMEIVKADDVELNKIGTELLEIEKKLMMYNPNKRTALDKIKNI